jgi:hypothetical protein
MCPHTRPPSFYAWNYPCTVAQHIHLRRYTFMHTYMNIREIGLGKLNAQYWLE